MEAIFPKDFNKRLLPLIPSFIARATIYAQHQKKFKSTFISQNDDKSRRADRLVWLGYHPYEVMVAGSNPARPTIFIK